VLNNKERAHLAGANQTQSIPQIALMLFVVFAVCSVQQALFHPVLLRWLGVPLAGLPTLAEQVEGFMPHAQQLLADGSPHVRSAFVLFA
jgi:hypothetical protein